MASVAGIDKIRNDELFYHGTSLKSWTNPMWGYHGSLHLINDMAEAEYYGEETSISDDASPVIIVEISGAQIKELYRKNIIQTISPDSNWEYEEVYDDSYNEYDAWYESYQELGIIVINGDISAVKRIMTYKMWHKDAGGYIDLSYDEIMAIAEQENEEPIMEENIDTMLNHLKEVFIAECTEEGDDEQMLRETVEKMLKPGTVFWRDVKKVTNQITFKQYLENSGVPESIKKPIYDNIQRFRSLADLFPDKSFVWKGLYLGAVYQALSDNSGLNKVMNK